MSEYSQYLSAITMIVDAPGERQRQVAELDASRNAAAATVAAADQHLAGRWSAASRRLRELDTALQRLARDANVTHPASVASDALCTIDHVEHEIAALTSDSSRVDSAIAWVVRARSQVAQERSRVQGGS
jgi:hypothetical protein